MSGATSVNRLMPLPPREVWFAGIESGHNRKGYMRDVGEFMDHAGLAEPEGLRDATPERAEAWREALLDAFAQSRRRCAASSRRSPRCSTSCSPWERSRPTRSGASSGPPTKRAGYAAPVLTGEQARRLLDAPPQGTIKGLRDRAILAVMLCQGLTREELCGLSVGDLAVIDGQLCLRVAGNRGRMRIAALASRDGAADRGLSQPGGPRTGPPPGRSSARSPTIAAAGD